MKIIDKQKDYYDYFAGIYGIDKTVCFDRRGSKKMSQGSLIRMLDYDGRRLDYLRFKIKPHGLINLYGIVEAGYFQYLFRVFNIINKAKHDALILDGDFELLYVFDDHKHYFHSPLNLYPVSINGLWGQYSYYYRNLDEEKKKTTYNYKNDIVEYKGKLIENPIFSDTKIPSILDAHTIYTNIFDYISSKSDFDIVDTRGDIAKAVDHGFDKRTSFRRM
jgi:hypothetical protein